MFANAHIYRLKTPWNVSPEQIEEELSKNKFRPCGSQDAVSSGWVPPRHDGELVFSQSGHVLVSLCIETKMLPASVIRKKSDERAKKIGEQQGYHPGRKQMKEIKEMVLQELLPIAFTKQERISAWVDGQNGWIVINTSSTAKADEVIGTLIKSINNFPAESVHTQVSPMSAMSDWLVGGEAPLGFTIDRECELKDTAGDKPTVKYSKLSLDREEIKQHIGEGKLPTKLAMTWDDRISFILTEKMHLKKVVYIGIEKEEASANSEDAEALFGSMFALMTGEFPRFFGDLVEALGGEIETEE